MLLYTDTNELYEQLGLSIPDKYFEDMDNSISKIFEGYNTTIFAYG